MKIPFFADNLKRSDLLGWTMAGEDLRPVSVNVFRNHSFEMTASVLPPFAGFAGLAPSFNYSDYDDSLNFSIDQEADLNLIWLDLARYKTEDLGGWLLERATALRALSTAPILACCLSGSPLALPARAVPDFFWLEPTPYLQELGEKALDEAKLEYSGTRLSSQACLRLARVLGLKYLPAILKPALKAVVVDLDNTLYEGVLGEDGLEALVLTPEHEALQKKLKNLNEEGFFLGLASKNETVDVVELFARRRDFPLNLEDFAVVKADWRNKADNLREMAGLLNIGPEAMLFIDDNPAEIQNVEAANLGIRTLLAESPAFTVNALSYYPGLMKLSRTSEDALRSQDSRANQTRRKMMTTLSREEYFKKLAIQLTYGLDPAGRLPRIAELLGKTNQFILSYKRYNQTQVKEIMDGRESAVVTVSMSDALSESGLIAIIVGRRDESRRLVVDELVVSCRALGRNIEDIMLLKAFQLLADHLGTEGDILIPYLRGPRNRPALEWLNRVAEGRSEGEAGLAVVRMPDRIEAAGLEITVEGADR